MSIFDIKGSNENEYKVSVLLSGTNSVKMLCNCQAGIFGKICKHKLAVATGDPVLLLHAEDEERLREISEKIKLMDIGKLLQNLYTLKKEYDSINRKMVKARKALESAMKG